MEKLLVTVHQRHWQNSEGGQQKGPVQNSVQLYLCGFCYNQDDL